MTYTTWEARQQADKHNAQIARDALQAELGPDAPAVVLWMHDTVGCYGVDGDGREWSTWSGPAVTCDECGAQIQGGYHTPGWLPGMPHTEATMAQRQVCASHVRTFSASRAAAAEAIAQRDAYMAEQATLPNHLRDLPEHT